jgi:hypothetical protein
MSMWMGESTKELYTPGAADCCQENTGETESIKDISELRGTFIMQLLYQ